MLRTKKPWTADGPRRTDIWITKSLPELSSGETMMIVLICRPLQIANFSQKKSDFGDFASSLAKRTALYEKLIT